MAEASSSSSSVDQPSPLPSTNITHRVFHPPKLERKHSSGDLHSRLKTRKILGVGETDNGDIHRSKISQLLGHNEHLYVKFPRGFWVWHLFMAVLFTVQGFLAFALPEKTFTSPLDSQALFLARLHGAALLAFALCLWMVIPKIQCSYSISSICTFLWNFQGTMDKAQARSSLLAIMLYYLLQLGVCVMSVIEAGWPQREMIGTIIVQLVLFLVNLLYHRSIGRSTSGLRKSSSYKDLTSVHEKKEGIRDDKRDATK